MGRDEEWKLSRDSTRQQVRSLIEKRELKGIGNRRVKRYMGFVHKAWEWIGAWLETARGFMQPVGVAAVTVDCQGIRRQFMRVNQEES